MVKLTTGKEDRPMTVEELKALLEAGTAPLVLDVREAWELERAALPMPVLHIPLGTLPARCGEIPKEGLVVCSCHSGGRSAQAVRFLRQRGWNAVNLEGGIHAWSMVDPACPTY
jgi:rhodanese-related sulfurtransferase